jgi:voltage-gated potassium channel
MVDNTGYFRENLRRVFYKRTFVLTILASILVVWTLGSFVIYLLERGTNPDIRTYGDAVWMLIVTMTTVGYGDKVPITTWGRVVDMFCMISGIALLTTAITAGATVRISKAKRRARGLEKKNSLRNHFLVCGWNNRGEYVLARLVENIGGSRTPIILLCELDQAPYEDDLVFFINGSPVSERDLRQANAGEAQSVVLMADETAGRKPGDIDARTVLAALSIKQLNPDAKITAEALVPENIAHLKLAGVEEILDYSVIAGNLLAQSAMRFGLIELITSLSTKGGESRIYRIPVTGEMVGRLYGEAALELECEGECSVLGIRTAEGVKYITEPGLKMSEGDVLIVMADEKPPGAFD